MPSMIYCRFENTLADLDNCFENMDDDLTGTEFRARKRLIELCKKIASEYEVDDFDEQDGE